MSLNASLDLGMPYSRSADHSNMTTPFQSPGMELRSSDPVASRPSPASSRRPSIVAPLKLESILEALADLDGEADDDSDLPPEYKPLPYHRVPSISVSHADMGPMPKSESLPSSQQSVSRPRSPLILITQATVNESPRGRTVVIPPPEEDTPAEVSAAPAPITELLDHEVASALRRVNSQSRRSPSPMRSIKEKIQIAASDKSRFKFTEV